MERLNGNKQIAGIHRVYLDGGLLLQRRPFEHKIWHVHQHIHHPLRQWWVYIIIKMRQCLLLTRVCACLLRNTYWFNAHKEPSSSLPLQVKCLSACDNKIICWHWLSLCHWTGKQGWKQVVSEQASSLKRSLQSGLSCLFPCKCYVASLYKACVGKGWQHVVNSECQAVCACAVGRMCVWAWTYGWGRWNHCIPQRCCV